MTVNAPAAQSSVGAGGRTTPAARPRHGLTTLALCFASGIAAGSLQPRPLLGPALAMSVLLFLLGVTASRRTPTLLFPALGATMVALGVAWINLHHQRVEANNLAAWVGSDVQLVRLEGVALAGPTVRHRVGGSLARFDYRPPSAYFPMQVDRMTDRHDKSAPVRGRVLVRVGETVSPFRAGDRVRVSGHLIPFEAPRNPGEFDVRAYARSLGQAGVIDVPSRELVEVDTADRWPIIESWLAWRETAQRRASAWLLAGLPGAASPQRDAFLAAILLGQREPELDGLDETFQRVGLAHLLAISGLHLGILAGLVLLVARGLGFRRSAQGLAVIAVVLIYLILVEVRLPVLRAGVMLIAASSGLLIGRYLKVSGLIALSGIALLLWRPDQLMTPGFQLSFGVVLGLVHLAPPLRERWFGRPDRRAASTAEMFGQWLRSATTIAIVAWLIATPIIAHHFGVVAPLGVPLSVPAVPVVALLLAIGYAKLVLELVLPSAALLLGIPLAVIAESMLSFVQAIDELPGSVMHVPFPSATWTLTSLAVIGLWASPRELVRGRRAALIGALLVGWLLLPLLPLGRGPALRIDMLAVGDGSCFILRSGRETIVFDAGSSTSLNAGRLWIVPAMRRLGVRSIDALLISHPDIDHYSAAIEIVDDFAVERVIVTPPFIERVESEPFGPAAHLAQGLTDRLVRLETANAGDALFFGEATLTWLHPNAADGDYGRDNDRSMVIRLDAAGRTAVLTGDVEREGLARLMPRASDLRADIVELPHHGSYNELASAFVAMLQPRVVMQSTGRSRWERDRWGTELRDIERLVTHRDGACTVVIEHDGTIRTERFREDSPES